MQSSQRYIAERLRSPHTDEEWKKLIFTEHAKLVGKTKDATKNAYLAMAQELPLYGAIIFPEVESKNAVCDLAAATDNSKTFGLPPRFDFAINITGLHILDSSSKVVTLWIVTLSRRC